MRRPTHRLPQRICLTTPHFRPAFAPPWRRRTITITTYPSTPASRVRPSYSGDRSPTTSRCPPSPCACAATPLGLEIDHDRPLNGTVPPYAHHVVVRTGRDDWASRIEEEDESVEGTKMNFARSLKGLVGKGGKFFDPERPILISNSSLAANQPTNFTSVHVFPKCLDVPQISHTPEAHEQFVSQFLHGSHVAQETQVMKAGLDQEAELHVEGSSAPDDNLAAHTSRLHYMWYPSPTILICGHNSRDTRCGILGPLLRAEFNLYIEGSSRLPADAEHLTGITIRQFRPLSQIGKTRVTLTSHIGGHAFAGNVIIYLPKKFRMANGEVSPLAGKGIWYGRVEPKHVWGIMEETVQHGRVIEELLRGISKHGIGGHR